MHRAPGHCPPGSVCHLGWAAVQAAVNRRKFGTTDRSSSLPSTQVLLVMRSSRNLRRKCSDGGLVGSPGQTRFVCSKLIGPV
jgi:hypothetical protein